MDKEKKIIQFQIMKIIEGKPQYSSGGSWPRFTNRGKVWKNLGALRRHLRKLDSRYPEYESARLVVLDTTIIARESSLVSEMLEDIEQEKIDKDRERQERAKNAVRTRDLAELARLKRLYEPPK